MEHGAAMLDIGSRFNDNDLQAFGLMVQGMAHIAKAAGRTGHVADRRSHRGGGRRRAQSTRDRQRLLHDDRRVPGPRGLQACRRVDRCDDSMVRAPSDQRLPRPLSGAPGGDHPTPWSVRRRRGRGSPRGPGAASRSANCRSRAWASMRSGRSVFGWATSTGPRRRSQRHIECGNDGAARVGAPAARARALGRGSLIDPCGPHRSASGVGAGTAAAGAGRDRAGVPRRDGGTRGRRGAARDRIDVRRIAVARERPPGSRSSFSRYEGDALAARSPSSGRRSVTGPTPTFRSRPRRRVDTSRWPTEPNGDEASAVLELQAAHATFERLGASSRPRDASRRSTRARRRPDDGSLGRSCSPTSSARRTCSRRSVTMRGRTWCGGTTRRCDRRSSRSTGRSCTRPGTDSSRRSRTRRPRHRAPSRSRGCWQSIDGFTDSHHRFGSDCTRQRRRSWSTTTRGWACIKRHGSARSPESGEIVVTCETVEGEPIPYAVSNERAVSLKGIARPVRVVSIDWRT